MLRINDDNYLSNLYKIMDEKVVRFHYQVVQLQRCIFMDLWTDMVTAVRISVKVKHLNVVKRPIHETVKDVVIFFFLIKYGHKRFMLRLILNTVCITR